MKVIECDFLAGAGGPDRFPPATLPEVAFLGRSNVGKSSLINSLVGRRQLARIGSTPGRTRQVNFYRVNRACLFVDLPGYGFARISRAERAAWRRLVEAYLGRPAPAKLAVLLIDARLPVTDPDREMKAWLDDNRWSYVVAATKSDKLSGNERRRRFQAQLKEFHRPGLLIPCSARTREGISELWAAIDGMLNETKSSPG